MTVAATHLNVYLADEKMTLFLMVGIYPLDVDDETWRGDSLKLWNLCLSLIDNEEQGGIEIV